MCSSGSRYNTAEATRLANISNIKSQQLARQAKTNIVLGSEAMDYKRNFAQGAKQIGTTAVQESLKTLSASFSGNIGAAGKERAAYLAEMEKRRKRQEVIRSGGLA